MNTSGDGWADRLVAIDVPRRPFQTRLSLWSGSVRFSKYKRGLLVSFYRCIKAGGGASSTHCRAANGTASCFLRVVVDGATEGTEDMSVHPKKNKNKKKTDPEVTRTSCQGRSGQMLVSLCTINLNHKYNFIFYLFLAK